MFQIEYEEQTPLQIQDLQIGDVFLYFDAKYLKTNQPSFCMDLNYFNSLSLDENGKCEFLFNIKMASTKNKIGYQVTDTLTFDMVEENQFFICENRGLFQKMSEDYANRITDKNGIALSDKYYFNSYDAIKKIIPKIKSIKWIEENV